MLTTLETQVRELDRRRNDGIEVRLLWNPQRERISVAVNDERSGRAFEFEVERAHALAAFHHPYVYADARLHSSAPRPQSANDDDQARAA